MEEVGSEGLLFIPQSCHHQLIQHSLMDKKKTQRLEYWERKGCYVVGSLPKFLRSGKTRTKKQDKQPQKKKKEAEREAKAKIRRVGRHS